jgi:hypothetical protein
MKIFKNSRAKHSIMTIFLFFSNCSIQTRPNRATYKVKKFKPFKKYMVEKALNPMLQDKTNKTKKKTYSNHGIGLLL